MSHRSLGIWIAVASMAAFGVGALAQTSPPKTSKPTKPAAPREAAVATVGGRRITRAAFEERVREAEATFRSQSASPLPAEYRPMMRRQILEGLIREQLLALEAARRGMSLSREQAEDILKREPFFQRDGMTDEAKFLAIKTTQPREFENAIAEIQRSAPARRLKEQIERQHRPSEAKLRADLERQLSQVTIDFLPLRRASFSADRPEPSVREVIEYYRGHASEFVRPERVNLTLVTVDRPRLDEQALSTPAALQTWESKIRVRAESLLTAVRGGARLEDLIEGFGSVRTETVERSKFPEIWRGDARSQQQVFSTAPGNWLSQPIPGRSGVLLARVDQHQPEGVARLRAVAPTILTRLRGNAQRAQDEQEMRAIYEEMGDSLRGPAVRIRYGFIDTALVRVSDPSSAEIDRYYRGHQADYSYFDSNTGSLGARPLSEVAGDVRARILRERRLAAARTAAEQLADAWRSGKRDAKTERAMTAIREVGPISRGMPVDTGFVGQILTDSLEARLDRSVHAMRYERGWIVSQIVSREPSFKPSFEQARGLLGQRLEPRRTARLEAEARKLYEAEPKRFRSANSIHFTRVMVNAPDPLAVPVSRAEVEQHYKTHFDEYGAPELSRARHLLVTPRDASPEADAEARKKAEDLLRRVKAGESIAKLAREHSDDEATRNNGGDVGVFRHGMMLDEFERAAFALKPGEIAGPVRSEVGYHVIECLDHVPAEVTPLKYAYSNVSGDVARLKSQRIAKARADSLQRVLRTPAQALAAAQKMQMLVFRNEHVIGSPISASQMKDYFARLENLKPGKFDSVPQEYQGMGYAVTWVDSIVPPRKTGWEIVRDQAVEQHRREVDRAKLMVKRAELDSLLRAGWSFDSLGAVFGGLERHGPRGPGSGLERMAGRELLDSLAFGAPGIPPVLETGKVTGWIEFPAGWAKLRLVERRTADPVQLASRLENEGRGTLERNLRGAYETMKRRFPVEIHDLELRTTELPPISDS